MVTVWSRNTAHYISHVGAGQALSSKKKKQPINMCKGADSRNCKQLQSQQFCKDGIKIMGMGTFVLTSARNFKRVSGFCMNLLGVVR